MIQKRCCECGEVTAKLYESMCLECYKAKYPPVQQIKPLNIKRCNHCGRFHVGNQLYSFEELQQVLPGQIRKQVVLNPRYELSDLHVENLEIEGEELSFDVVVHSDICEERSYS